VTALAMDDAETEGVALSELATTEVASTAAPVAKAGPSVSPVSVILGVDSVIMQQLQHGPQQWANALIALLAGLGMVVNGDVSFEILLVLAGALLGYVLTIAELEFHLGDEHSLLQNIAGVESAFVVALVTQQGLRGAKYLTGALLGLLCTMLLYHWGSGVEWAQHWLCEPTSVMVMLNLFVLLGLAAVRWNWYRKVLGIIFPVVGGWLAASALMFFFAEAAYRAVTRPKHVETHLHPDQMRGPWIVFAEMLLKPLSASSEAGVFAGYHDIPIYGKPRDMLDRCMGWLIWSIFMVVGIVWHAREYKNSTKKVGSREALKEPLLPTSQSNKRTWGS